VIHGIRLTPTYLYRAPAVVARYGAGPSLEYAAQLFDRATGRSLPNTPVELRRVAGIAVDQPSFATTSDAGGYVRFHARPLQSGSLIADIIVHPPHGNQETRRETIPTFDD